VKLIVAVQSSWFQKACGMDVRVLGGVVMVRGESRGESLEQLSCCMYFEQLWRVWRRAWRVLKT
jgi:hypothetical protein